jgi:hypothetical protein
LSLKTKCNLRPKNHPTEFLDKAAIPLKRQLWIRMEIKDVVK